MADQFCALTGAPPATAEYYIATFGSIDAAISGFFDSGGAPPPAVTVPAVEAAAAATEYVLARESELPACNDAGLAAAIAAAAEMLPPADAAQRLFADECAYSFDTPYNASGLYLNLATQVAVGPAYLARGGAGLYVLQRWRRVRSAAAEVAASEAVAKPAASWIEALEAQQKEEDAMEVVREASLVVVDAAGAPSAPVPFPYAGIPDTLYQRVMSTLELAKAGGTKVSILVFTVTLYANHAHNLTRSP
jgi:hypothetical protein